MDKTRSDKAGEAFAKAIAHDPANWKSVQKKMLRAGVELKLLSQIREATISKTSQVLSEIVADQDRLLELQLAEIQENFRIEIDQIDEAWQKKFGEPPPKSKEELIQWAVRVGWDGEFVRNLKWSPSNLYPYIEGKLLKLADEIEVSDKRAHAAHANKLFPLGPPNNIDLQDAIVFIDSHRDSGKSYNDLIQEKLECSKEDAKKMAKSIRSLRSKGRTTLPAQKKRI